MGALRRAGVWLGLVEEEDERAYPGDYDDDFGEDEDFTPVRPRSSFRGAERPADRATLAERAAERAAERERALERERMERERADRERAERHAAEHSRAERTGERPTVRPLARPGG